MAWFEAHEELPRHPKTLKLARALKKNKYETVGLLWCLFSWGLTAAQKDGSLPGMTAEDISMALDWPGKKSCELVEGLLFSGYLDLDGDTYCIHDWYDYSGKLGERKEADKVRKSVERARKKTGQSVVCPQDVRRTSDGQDAGHPTNVRGMSQSPALPPSSPLLPSPQTPYSTTPYYPPSHPLNQTLPYPTDGVVEYKATGKAAAAETDILTDLETVRQAWNSLGLTQIGPIDPMTGRGAALQNRLEKYGTDFVLKAVQAVKNSAFLRGDNGKGWKASLDWVLQEDHLVKAAEGGYDDFKAEKKPEKSDQELRDEKYGTPKSEDMEKMRKALERLEAGQCLTR